MNIRIRAILVIILTNLVIIMFSVSTGIIFVKTNMGLSMESDLTVMSNIADHFLSIELDYLKLKASGTAKSLEMYDETKWPEILSEQSLLYPEFIGMAVVDSSGELIASFGEMAANPNVITDYNIHQAFPPIDGITTMGRSNNAGGSGRNAFSSTVQTENGVVFYLAVPLPFSPDRILVATLPGNYFSLSLSNFVIWETGHIFMSDSDGFAIANPREHWVQNRFNYVQSAQTDSSYEKLAETVTRMTLGETGIGYYSVDGIPRVCSFRPVSRSEEGWSLGVVSPLPESPAKNTDRGLLIVAVISIVLNIIAAIIASNFIKKPFEKIETLIEEADAANKAKSIFLSTMSHEIRTPMNAILGVSEIQLQNESLDPPIREAFVKIFASGDLLLNIINDILDLSKIEAGKLELLIGEYEIASLISDTAQLNMMRIGSKHIKFDLDIDENIPSHLMGDELRIKQVLNNLLSNAFKYTKEGNVKFSIQVKPAAYGDSIYGGISDDTVTLIFTVSDTGQGMTKEQIGMIFDVYSQFNKKANRSIEGTGLGMSITHNLISLMKGNITIESELGKGSSFTVRLPQGLCDSRVLGNEVARNLEQFHMRSKDFIEKVKMPRDPMPYGSVLVVDDVDANIYVAKGLLSLYDIKIYSAKSGSSAIEKIKNGEKYDIIFMDHMMPEMDGIEATRHIRELGYTDPIIALSANAIAGQVDVFKRNGFDDFISKPIDLRHLNLLLNKYVRDKQPRAVIEEARKQAQQKKQKNDSSVTVQDESDSLLKGAEIPGIDVAKGIKRFDGNEQMYLDVLRAYAAGVNTMLGEIETVNEQTLDSYKIKVHGIKGTSYDIFAEQIAKEALELENAAKSGNYEFIKENNETFIKNARTLISHLEDLFISLDSEKQKPLKDKPNKKVLLKLISACKDFDMDDADEAMAELENYKYESDNDLIGWLRNCIDRMQFEQIVEKLNSYI